MAPELRHAWIGASPELVSQKGWRDQGRPGCQSSNYPHGDGGHTRKFSDSVEVQREQQVQERTPDAATVPTMAEFRESYGTLKRAHHFYDDEQRDNELSWRVDQALYKPQHISSTSTQDYMEKQIGDALRRLTGQMGHRDDSQTSPDVKDGSIAAYGRPYGPEHKQDSILHHDSKACQRNLSSLARTGCLTCRKRKKKCDEHKPECSECIRSEFPCAEYLPQRWPSRSAAIPLESKDSIYFPPGAYDMLQYGACRTLPVNQEPFPRNHVQTPRIDPPKGSSLVILDDERPTASTLASASIASPKHKLPGIAYAPGPTLLTPVSASTQSPSFGDGMVEEHYRVPPLHGLSRNEPKTPHPGNALRQINILHQTRMASPTPHPQLAASNAHIVARRGLTHAQYTQRQMQKEAMLSGGITIPSTRSCAWTVSAAPLPAGKSRLFLEILKPRDPVRVSPTEALPITNVGRAGRYVAVEAPFTCDYGYNITIGHHVVIGRNCTINDVCEVKIGDNCVIGPNVSIFTASLPTHPYRGQSGHGPQFGRAITIAQDCWIGGGAIILPGRTIGKGSTIGAGCIVTKAILFINPFCYLSEPQPLCGHIVVKPVELKDLHHQILMPPWSRPRNPRCVRPPPSRIEWAPGRIRRDFGVLLALVAVLQQERAQKWLCHQHRSYTRRFPAILDVGRRERLLACSLVARKESLLADRAGIGQQAEKSDLFAVVVLQREKTDISSGCNS
ncbi:hypothetical protein ACCO45_004474 [Purpureocillium lilacinum]|uniref:Uncharacterized protein n=1 Tax=Purpureocillium lilacinum TaxID=33203 RepID=A0ACC4E5P0_PURLI